MYTAFRDLLIARDGTLFRAYILALLVQMAIIHGLRALSLLVVEPFAFTWLASIVGSFIFGLGEKSERTDVQPCRLAQQRAMAARRRQL